MCYGDLHMYAEPLPSCDVDPAGLDFGVVTIGESQDLEFTITNVGGGRLIDNVSETCDQFSIAWRTGTYDLAAGEPIAVVARFHPKVPGRTTV